MPEPQANNTAKKASFPVRFLRWPFKGKGWRRWARLTVAVLVLYNLYACVTLRRPPVWGRVIDKETGAPIAGAEVYARGIWLWLIPPVEGGAGFGHATTNASGYFFLPAKFQMSMGPYLIVDTALSVHTPDHVTGLADLLLVGWRVRDSRREPYVTTTWTKIPILGHFCTIALAKAADEKAWIVKCKNTESAKDLNVLPEDVQDRWLFADLTGYLERWPQGEKAGDFVLHLADIGMGMAAKNCGDSLSALENVSAAQLRSWAGSSEQILKIMDKTPIEQVTQDPVLRTNWPAKRKIIAECQAQVKAALLKKEAKSNAR